MTLQARLYLFLTYVAGLLLLFSAFNRAQVNDLWLILLWIVIATPLEIRPIRAGVDLQYTLSFTIHLTLTIIYGIWDAIIVAALVTAITDLIGKKGIIKLLFNVSQFTISIYASGIFFMLFKKSSVILALPDDLFAFVGASVTYILINLFLVSVIVALVQKRSIFSVAKADFKVIILNYLALAPISMLMILLYKEQPLTMIVILPLLVIADSSFRSYISLKVETKNTLEILADFVDRRDHYTSEHSQRVTVYASAIAQEMGINDENLETIEMAGRVHDLGKIGISDYILMKPGRLTDEEMDAMREHPQIAYSILKPLNMYKQGAILVKEHHERYDGLGYPQGLKGKGINIGSRILAVADTYDAMTTDRPYRKAMSKEEAINELKQNAGTQFDPEVVDAFLRVLNSNHLGVI